MSYRENTLGACVAAAFGALITAAMPASAATIGINGPILTATAEPSGDQIVLGQIVGGDLQLLGVDFEIVTPGCSGSGAVLCDLAGVTEVRIVMGSGADVVELSGIAAQPSLVFFVLGGAGDDVLIGSEGVDRMYGGPGDDVLLGGAGDGCLSGGPGDNVLIPPAPICNPDQEPVFPPAEPIAVPAPGGWALLPAALAMLGWHRRRANSRPLKSKGEAG